MKVSFPIYHSIQRAVYEGEYQPELIPVYHEYADFCETNFENPEYIKLLEGLIKIEIE